MADSVLSSPTSPEPPARGGPHRDARPGCRSARRPRLRRPPRRNPYRVPRPAVVSFSGGRTSGYLLKHIVDAYGGRLPSDVSVVFANTGMERPETLDFVDTCARAWGVDVAWLEYDWSQPHRTRVVDHRTASRAGEPFAALIERKGFVPSVNIRFCTGFLEARPHRGVRAPSAGLEALALGGGASRGRAAAGVPDAAADLAADKAVDKAVDEAVDKAAGPDGERKDFFIERDGLRFAGVHLIIDLHEAERLDDLAYVEQVLRDCVTAARASLLHIHLHHFTPNGGVSGVAVLAESHISVHTWPECGYAAFDVFMCGATEPHRTVEVLKAAFKPGRLTVSEHLRGAAL